MLFATSCQNDLDFDTAVGKTSTVSFSVGTPEIATRAYSDGATATKLQYAVYNAAGEELTDLTVTNGEIHGSTTVNLQLTTGNTYSVIFWAAAEDAPYSVDFGTKTMTVDYNGAVSNAENRDAFFKYHTFTVKGAQTETIELKRPFAQLNIGTADYAASDSAGYVPTQSAVVVKNVYNTLNLATGVVENEVEANFALANIKKDETFPVNGYEYLAMNYLLVSADKTVVDVEFTYTDGSNAKTRTVGSVPVQRNYRTNIYGKLLTSDVDINVEIKPGYDGEFDNEGYFVEDGKVIVESANGLVTIADAIADGTLPSNTDIVLDGDIDLSELAALTRAAVVSNWTPVGTSEKPYTGTFDGKGYTIKNLVINGGSQSNIGFFGVTMNGEIKNVTFENAKVSGYLNVGVVAGTPYTSKYTNITVKGHVEVDGMAYVGAVGGKNAYANWTNVTVNVDETSYVNANSVQNGTAYRSYVGGVVGFNGEGGHTFSNIYSNINVKGSTCDVGGLFGIAHYSNNFVNCVCDGDVEIYAASEEAEAQEIGGIAGVWHNENGTKVTFTNCSFTGELKANNNYVINTKKFGNLVCSSYNSTGTGILVIDGTEYTLVDGNVVINGCTPVSTADELVAALEANKGVYLLNDITVAATKGGYSKAGILQNKAQTIDGGGHTLTVTGAGATWDCAIYTNGGVIRNLTVAGAMRGIFTAGQSADLKIDNVEFKNVIYTFNSDGNMPANPFGVYVSNSTVNGWTSHSDMHTEVVYTNCSFGEGSGYAYCRPYGKTAFVNCTFSAGYSIDKTRTTELTFANCIWE